MIKAVAFDLDDTLVNIKEEGLIKVFKKIHKKLGIREFSEIERLVLWLKPNRDNFVRERLDIDPKDYWKIFNKYYTIKEMKDYMSLFFDLDALATLKERGKKIGILTSSSKDIGDYKIKLIEEKFGNIIDYSLFVREHNIPDKPDPIGLEMLMDKLNVRKDEIVLVGDSDCDILTAKNAGVTSMLVERLHNTNGIIESIPDYTLKNLYQIGCYIDN
ncbi:MAG: HAD-IA family hydrolase [Nanoarchaeota archaeon]|nr:HAD-IA family hydrolase [Nanoarchaeota archaeon]MBU0962314.1 HAD-IA family hydrolase [Nanoarchaeota archaeon]